MTDYGIKWQKKKLSEGMIHFIQEEKKENSLLLGRYDL